MQIYLFQAKDKEGELTDIQLYANDYYEAWDCVVLLNPVYEDITLNGIEFTTLPYEWDLFTNEIRLTN